MNNKQLAKYLLIVVHLPQAYNYFILGKSRMNSRVIAKHNKFFTPNVVLLHLIFLYLWWS